MRCIKDHAYLFSLAKINNGIIMASRTSRTQSGIGENISLHLGICESEIAYLNEKMKFGSDNVFFLANVGGKDKAAVMLRFFSYTSSMALVVVFDLSAVAIARIVDRGVISFSVASEALLAFGENGRCTPDEEHEAYVYITEMLGMLAPLYALRLQYRLPKRETVRAAIRGAAHFVGVGIDCILLDHVGDKYYAAVGNVFTGPICAATFILCAMEARMLAPDRSMRFEVKFGYRSMAIYFSFSLLDNSEIDSLAFLSEVSKSRSVCMLLDYTDRCVNGYLSPFYVDKGLSGVKERGTFIKRTDIEINLYNYPRITYDFLRQ